MLIFPIWALLLSRLKKKKNVSKNITVGMDWLLFFPSRTHTCVCMGEGGGGQKEGGRGRKERNKDNEK